jgi:hypothetical protein
MKDKLKYYWAVKTFSHLIHLYADSVAITDNGDLVFFKNCEPSLPLISFSKGNWIYFHAASCIDGNAVCVEHWELDGK